MKKYTLLLLSLLTLAACSTNDRNDRKDNGPIAEIDMKNIRTYKGQILQIINIPDQTTGQQTIGVLMRTERGDIPVQLGPEDYVMGGAINIVPNKMIEVRGSEMYLNGSIFVIATEAKVDGYTLKLRDRDGFPLWSNWKRD